MKIVYEKDDIKKLPNTTLAIDIENGTITFVVTTKAKNSGKIYIVDQGRVHIEEHYD